MDYIISIVRLIIMIASFSGYALWLWKRYQIESVLLSAIIFSSITTVLFIGAILNLLFVTTALLFFGGIVLLALYCLEFHFPFKDVKLISSVGLLFFIAMCGYLIVFLRGSRLVAYDDFSHWGTIVHDMLLNNRLPNFASDAISFPTYPPASALFVYYIAKIIGPGENKMLMAQMFMTVSFASVLFLFAGKGKKSFLPCVIAGLGSCFLLTIFPHSIISLLVDALLPLSALANTAILIFYRNDIKKASILSLPLMTMTLLIKNSGLFFVAINIVLLIWFALRTKRSVKENDNAIDSKKLLKYVFLSIAIPVALLVLWKQHVKLVFPVEATTGHHAVSLSDYIKNYTEKPAEQITDITRQFIDVATNLKTKNNKILMVWSICALLIYLISCFSKRRAKATLTALICIDGIYILYSFGVYLVQLFSMPPSEASSFVSYGRYVNSIIIYGIGVLLLAFLIDLEKFETKKLVRTLCSFMIVLMICYCFIFTKGHKVLYEKLHYQNSRAYSIDVAIKDCPVGADISYLIYSPKSATDKSQTHFHVKSKLLTKDFELIPSVNNVEELTAKMKEYDYFIVLDEDKAIQELMQNFESKDHYKGWYEVLKLLD